MYIELGSPWEHGHIAVARAYYSVNAYAERFVQTIQQECLDHFAILGEKHLNYIVSEFMTHYHDERPHQALGNEPRVGVLLEEGEVVCQERLGGLLRHYHRKVA